MSMKHLPLISTEEFKKKALEIGADLVGIGSVDRYDGTPANRDPRYILPTAKCVIGVAFRIPRGLMETMETQPYSYTALGVKNLAEEQTTIYLLKIARLIENMGYEACVQRSCPNLLPKGDTGANPEVQEAFPLNNALSVDGVRPAPDILLDFEKSGEICGLGTVGRHGKLITPRFGPYQRLTFIVTNAPFDADPMLEKSLCDQCGACEAGCPGHAIGEKGVDLWQCAVYYRGAHRDNPMITEGYLEKMKNRQDVLNGSARFDEKSAREIFPLLQFLPPTHYGYVPCLCGKKCLRSCYQHLMEKGVLTHE